ncbi:MAG: tail fiber domain-containing protein [Candidatus Kapabacteria bacterium]|nr:tail fiber domain-containing protein [Candidatus Kapabacteria bacterium]MDW8012842.1 tail fiber domain-containing protein [Bacteroidota bacterium]
MALLAAAFPAWGQNWSLTGNSLTGTEVLGSTNAQPLRLITNNTERMRILDNGNVGIGLTAPGQRLVVAGNIGLQAGAAAFVGTLDNNRLELQVNNQASLILNLPGTIAPGWSIQRDAGGNTRGLHAVDLQSARTAAAQVASGDYSVIGGGSSNTASGHYSTVGGGYSNTASRWYSTVGGGLSNTANGTYSTVGGGYSNTASGGYSTVGGGWLNHASDSLSAIPGGFNLKVGKRSFGFSGQTSTTQTDLSAHSNIAAFVDVDLWLYNVRNQASELRLYERSGAGTNYTALRAQDQGSDIVYELPATVGTAGQVLRIASVSGTTATLEWASVALPNGTADGQLLRWNQSATAWQPVGLSAGAGIAISNTATGITITNTGDTDASNDVTTMTSFSAAAASDATVSGTYDALDIQLKSGVVGSTELASGAVATGHIQDGAVTSGKIQDGTIVDADISASAAIAVSKLAAGSNGQVLATVDGVPTWTDIGSGTEMDPQVHDAAFDTYGTGRVAFWDDANNRLIGDENLFWDNTNKRLGIGTSTPQAKLHVHSSNIQVTSSTTGSSSGDGFEIELSGNDVQLRQNENAEIQFRTNAGSGTDTVKMRLTADGRLFFSPSNGASYRVDLPNSSTPGVGRIRANAYASYSSLRYKDEVRPIGEALGKVLRLRGVEFRWKPEHGGREDIGFILEEVAPVVPQVVDRDPQTGELLGMDYSRLTALLVEALKEEHRRNESLREKVGQMEEEVARLRLLVEQLLQERGGRGGETGGTQIHDAWLGQNIPNPHDGTTTVPYYIPAGVGRAELVVRDSRGRELRRVELPERGAHGQVTLEMRLLSAGVYEYSLVLDGRVVATRQMTLVR